jgi:hypothetical protein
VCPDKESELAAACQKCGVVSFANGFEHGIEKGPFGGAGSDNYQAAT